MKSCFKLNDAVCDASRRARSPHEKGVLCRIDGATSTPACVVLAIDGGAALNVFLMKFTNDLFCFSLLTGCRLRLKSNYGDLDHTMLPPHYKQCTVLFPTSSQQLVLATAATTAERVASTSSAAEMLPGLVVQMTRLNIPCNSATSISFSRSSSGGSGSSSDRVRKLCGKLEEYLLDERTFYFREHQNTSVQLSGSPVFRFTYKLVDYCYNVTISDKNNSIFLQPIQSSLDCNFRIHLPYGNRISFSLITNLNSDNVAAMHPSSSSSNTSDGRSRLMEQERVELGAPTAHQPTNCDSGSLRVELLGQTGGGGSWATCVSAMHPPKLYLYTSSDNVLAIHVTKTLNLGASDDAITATNTTTTTASTTSDTLQQQNSAIAQLMPSLHFEYNAVSIDSITSPKCAFGWITLNQQSCVTVVDDAPASWHAAFDECERRGAKLAAIRSENDQLVVDRLILNR